MRPQNIIIGFIHFYGHICLESVQIQTYYVYLPHGFWLYLSCIKLIRQIPPYTFILIAHFLPSIFKLIFTLDFHVCFDRAPDQKIRSPVIQPKTLTIISETSFINALFALLIYLHVFYHVPHPNLHSHTVCLSLSISVALM